MILSFSIESMRPMIEAGIRQANGEDVGDARVKRQTIREMKPHGQWEQLFLDPDAYTLTLVWRQRSPDRKELGIIRDKRCTHIRIFRRHTAAVEIDLVGPIVLDGKKPRDTLSGLPLTMFSLIEPHSPLEEMLQLAQADGFETVKEFADFFVPKPGDVFEGVLIRW